MQVGNISSSKIRSTKKQPKAGEAGFSVDTAEEENSTIPVKSANIGSLWQLQAYDDKSLDLEIMQNKGNALLEELRKLRMGLLSEELDQENLESLSVTLDNAKIDFKYPELQEILDEIRLRAAVELAKFSK